jgi:hypothetical protein
MPCVLVHCDVAPMTSCHVALRCWGGSVMACHVAYWWDPHGWGGPMRCWHVSLTCWGGPMRCWHVAPSLSSLILCVYVWDPQFTPSSVSIPKLHPDNPLIESQPLTCLFNLFYLLWIYFNSFTHPKIMKVSPKISKFMMITPVIFNSTFASISLH